jgi:hypothetical protein
MACPFSIAEVPLENDAANITWNGITTHTMVARPPHLNVMDGDTTSEIDDSSYLNALAQFSDGRDFLMKEAKYTPHKVKVAEGYVINSIAWAIGGHAVTPCATFPNLVFSGINFTSFLADVALLTFFSPGALAALVALPWEEAVNSDMWMPDYDDNIFQSRGLWTHEYGHYALCSMMNDSSNTSFAQLTTATVQQIFVGSDIGTGDEARILNEAFADFFAAQVAGGTNYYAPPSGDGAQPDNLMSWCVGYPCLEKNRFETDTGHAVIARDITLFMDAFDGKEDPTWTDAGDSWTKTSSSPVTLGYASQKYADSCLAGNAVVPVGSSYTCDEPVTMARIGDSRLDHRLGLHQPHAEPHQHHEDSGKHRQKCEHLQPGVTCAVFSLPTRPLTAKLPQDLGLTAQVPIAQFVDVCQSSPIKDWIGSPPDPDLGRIFNPYPGTCEVCIPGSTPGPDRCTCAAHQIPATPYDGLNCLQCGANEIAVPLGPNWYCYGCGLGVAIDGQNACQCNLGAIPEADGSRCQCGPNSTQAADGTCPCITGATRGSDGICVGGCGQHEIWQGGQCVDCVDASWPNSTKTACLTCPPSAPLCIPPMFLLQCYSNCVVDCGDLNAPPEPGSDALRASAVQARGHVRSRRPRIDANTTGPVLFRPLLAGLACLNRMW